MHQKSGEYDHGPHDLIKLILQLTSHYNKESNMTLVKLPLFPLNIVVLPFEEVPLHIFEPRYRTMVDDCINLSRIIGVCHTKKQISAAPKNQTRVQSLSANQATYQPFDCLLYTSDAADE